MNQQFVHHDAFKKWQTHLGASHDKMKWNGKENENENENSLMVVTFYNMSKWQNHKHGNNVP